MGKKTKFLLLILALIGQFIGIKAAVIPFFILFRICCNATFWILLVSALAIVLVGGTLNVTLALKPRQKVLLKFALGQVFAGFFDNSRYFSYCRLPCSVNPVKFCCPLQPSV